LIFYFLGGKLFLIKTTYFLCTWRKFFSFVKKVLAGKLALNVYVCDWKRILESWKCHFFTYSDSSLGIDCTNFTNQFGLIAIENSYSTSCKKLLLLDFLLRPLFPRYFNRKSDNPKIQISFLGSATTAVPYHVASHLFYVLGIAMLPRRLINTKINNIHVNFSDTNNLLN